jgi:SAM-dependent methyltransferase
MTMSNRWNRIIYRLLAPIYDPLLDRFFMAPGRRQVFQTLKARPGERILLPGVGTGVDLSLLPEGVVALGVDLSPAMLAHAQARLPLPGRTIALVVGDAQVLPVPDGACDAAVLDLILSVVPDGAACLRATARAVKPGGRIVIFDKFLPETAGPGRGRRLLNLITRVFGTDINRHLGDLLADGNFTVIHDAPSLLSGLYRVVLIRTAAPSSGTASRAATVTSPEYLP